MIESSSPPQGPWETQPISAQCLVSVFCQATSLYSLQTGFERAFNDSKPSGIQNVQKRWHQNVYLKVPKVKVQNVVSL